jgi:predicted XRE-type DNA-binding protein
MKQQIREYHASHSDLTQQQISELFGVTAGRVSEALGGKRK